MANHPTVLHQLIQCVQRLEFERLARNPACPRRIDALSRLSQFFGFGGGACGPAAQPSRHRFRDPETGKLRVFLTNHRRWAAQPVADTYKSRWEVELFFNWLEQNLKIHSFLGHSMNAVASQGFVALCVYLMVAFQKFVLRSATSIQGVLRLVQLSLFQRKPSTDFLRGQKQLPRSPGTSEAEGRSSRPAVQPKLRRAPCGYHVSDTMLTTTALGIVRDYVAPLGKRVRFSGTVKSMGEGRQTQRVTNWQIRQRGFEGPTRF